MSTVPLTAPIGGTISTRVVQVGDAVAAGDTMFMVEAIKFPLAAEVSGVVAGIFVNEGDTFNEGDVIAEIDRSPGSTGE